MIHEQTWWWSSAFYWIGKMTPHSHQRYSPRLVYKSNLIASLTSFSVKHMTSKRVLRCGFKDNNLKVMNYAYILWSHSQYRPGTEMHMKIALVPLYFLLYHHSWVTQLVVVDSPWHSSWFSSSKNHWAFVNSLTKHISITTSSDFLCALSIKGTTCLLY